ncbi:exonuclease SbcCD subunit D [Oceanobacillus luteolus]|uniref:Nuclease SbcCD subunit D n=1 Tax=Oceanobacillus luteolus TaxID=1274358 RepID=A0ABW4HPV7_9BACI|nr:exonuclease SbcCD subunit D [Oceanobacillus luteolus]MCM3740210.1 exonuclease SbcCD subunit D [Oceanobacillus luteolus]
MKFFHTADWHLGKLVQGVYMTEDQAFILEQFIHMVEEEKPDAVIIAGDLYDRAVPPTDAIQLLDDVLQRIVLDLKVPVIAIAGNHDSPSRLDFGSNLMKKNGFHIIGRLTENIEPIILKDEFGEVYFHAIPYADPSQVRNLYKDDSIRNHNDAQRRIIEKIQANLIPNTRNIGVGHAFVTPYGEEAENTSESERPLSIGGSEYVDARLYEIFNYTALGHLHQAHYVSNETIRYAGSPLKYSISEEHHKKGFYIVTMDEKGNTEVEKRLLTPRREMRTVEGYMDEILESPASDDYVFVRLLDRTPVLSPMEKIRSVFPNAMHVERKHYSAFHLSGDNESIKERRKMTDLELFRAFYEEVRGEGPGEQAETIFKEALSMITSEDK